MLDKQRGFSLIELMVTVSVLALLLMAVVPTVGATLHTIKVRNAADGVLQGLQKAKTEAIKTNKNVTFSLVSTNDGLLDNTCDLASNSGAWVVSIGSPKNKCGESPSTSTSIVDKFASKDQLAGLTIETYDKDKNKNGAKSVTFNGYGQVVVDANALARIDFTNPTHAAARHLSVEIGQNGAIRMCDRNMEATDPRACPT